MMEELRELIEKSMREHDLPYQRKQSLIWGISTSAGFFVTQILFLMALNDRLSGFEIIPFWFVLIAVTVYASRKLAGLPEVKSYFSKLYSKFWVAGFFAIAMVIFIAFLAFPRYTGAFVAPVVGLLISIAGVMFKVRYTTIMGFLYSASGIAMFYLWQYQFLIFAVMQFLTLALPNLSAFKKDRRS